MRENKTENVGEKAVLLVKKLVVEVWRIKGKNVNEKKQK